MPSVALRGGGLRRIGKEVKFHTVAVMVLEQSPDWFHPVSLGEKSGNVPHPKRTSGVVAGVRKLLADRGWKASCSPGSPDLENILIVRRRRSGDRDRDVAQRQALHFGANVIDGLPEGMDRGIDLA